MRTFRRLVSFLLILTMVFSLFTIIPFEVSAAANVATWEELKTEISYYDSIALAGNIDAGGVLVIPSGRSVSLNLNGYNLSRKLVKEDNNGYVILIEQGATLTLTDQSGADGGIIGGYSKNGGGVYNKGTLNIQGGWIARNAASEKGGGVYNEGTLNFSGGTIGENTALEGAGIYNTGTVNMSGSARIIGNKTTQYGGGGISNRGTLRISGGEIRDNVAYTNGGGIWSGSGVTFEMTGGTVNKNMALVAGSGIYARGNIKMSGSPVINQNNADDVYLCPNKYIVLTGSLDSGADIGVTAKDTKRRITNNYSTYNTAPASQYFFESGEDTAVVGSENGEAVLATEGYIYVSRYWDSDVELALRQIKHKTDCIVMDSNTSYLENGKTYIVTENTTIPHRLYIVNEASIILYNNSTLTCQGAHVQGSHTLNVYSQYEDTGKLHAEGGSGKTTVIGGNYGESGGNINFFGGNIEAKLTEPSHSAVIGGGELGGSGSISIYGGSVDASDKIWGEEDYQRKGATIGSGEQAAYEQSNHIFIYGGNVKAYSHSSPFAAAIGGGYKSANGPIDILGGRLDAGSSEGGAIGSGTDCSQSGEINIKNCYIRGRIRDYYADNGCAVIGSGARSAGMMVNIDYSTVNITAYCRVNGNNEDADMGANGAGIGGGQDAGAGDVTIKNSIIQSSSYRGAGIGCGKNGTPGTIIIEDSWIAVKSKSGGAGIGGGDGTAAGDITIRRSTVTAITDPTTTTTVYNNQVISALDQVFIKFLFGGKMQDFGGSMYDFHLAASYAAGVLFASLMMELFTRTHTGAGIGGGDSGNGGNITIEDSITEAHGGDYAAGIGGGNLGTVNNITITGGEVISTSTQDAAGLGSGNSAPGGVTIRLSNAKVRASCPQDGSGIGTGDEASAAADIKITNCDVTANGGRYGAGIGGGDAVSGGTIVIENCPKVLADSETDGAGIGGGEGGSGGNITIRNCPDVTATGGGYAAGIGGGDDADGGTVTIYNSRVYAYGGTDAAGIGGGEDGNGAHVVIGDSSFVHAEGKSYGAGIGGGEDSDGGYCSISGYSTVEAVAGNDGWGIAIGYGDYDIFSSPSTGTLSLANYLKVRAGSNEYSTSEYKGDSRWSAVWNNKYAKIYPCDHTCGSAWKYYDNREHGLTCIDCGHRSDYDDHQWNSNNVCTICGAAAETITLTFIERNDSTEKRTELSIPKYSESTVPECTEVPDGYDFVCWKRGAEYYFPGDEIEAYGKSSDVYALYLPLVDTEYIDANGQHKTVKARKLTEEDFYNGMFLSSGWYIADKDFQMIYGITVCGDVNLIIADGKTIECMAEYYNLRQIPSVYAHPRVDYTALNIYGQTAQTGTFICHSCPVEVGHFNQYGCRVQNELVVLAEDSFRVGPGSLETNYLEMPKDRAAILGGNVTVNSLEGSGSLTLGWTKSQDSILINSISHPDNINVTVAEGQVLTDGTNIYTGTLTTAQVGQLRGKTLTPYLHNYPDPEWEWSDEYTNATAVFRCTDCDDVQRVKAKVTTQDSGNDRTANARCSFNGEEYSTTQTFRIIFDINVSDCEHGTVSARQTTARAGDRIALDITPDEGYCLAALYYTDSQNKRTCFEDNSFIMPASDVSVTAVFDVLDEVEYIDEDGNVKTVMAKPVTNNTTDLLSGWYYVDGSVSLSNDVELSGNVRLILCDDSGLVTTNNRIGKQDSMSGTALTVYRAPGENEGTLSAGDIYAETISITGGKVSAKNCVEGGDISVRGGSLSAQRLKTDNAFDISGGDVRIDGNWYWALNCGGDINISGGCLYVSPSSGGGVTCNGDLTISGGTVDTDGSISACSSGTTVRISAGSVTVAGELRGYETAITGGNTEISGQIYVYNDLTLGWTNHSDSIYAASYNSVDNIIIAEGQMLTDGTDSYSGTYTYSQRGLFDGKTLTPYAAQYIGRVEPTMDENGDYRPGTVGHYRLGNKNYAVNDDGEMGEELSDLSLSYFDFTLNGSEYQINYYTGPTENLTLLEIPKTFNGKKITILGNNDNKPMIDYSDKVKKQFELKLTENIEEIKPYAFYTEWVTKVTGDTSNLSKLGSYAFSWANSPGGFTLDITLDYEGNISAGSGAFNHMNVVAHLKHNTNLSTANTWYSSLRYDFTDAHSYGTAVWDWADDHSSATAAFTCTDNRCKHKEQVKAAITKTDERTKTTYTASAEFNGVTYTNTQTVEKSVGIITVNDTVHGSVSAAPSPAYEGEQVTLTITPGTGYLLKTLTVRTANNQDIEVSDSKFIMPSNDVTVTAEFGQNIYDIIYAETNGGWVRGAYSGSYGEEITLDVIPAGGYELDTLTVTDEDDHEIAVSGNKFTMPAGSVTVAATFRKRLLSVTYVVTDGQGTVTGASNARFNEEVPLTITPAEGYALLDLYAELDNEWDESANIVDKALIMPDCDAIVYASFVPITPAKEPWIDENGEYHPGCVEHYDSDGDYFAIKDGEVGESLDSIDISYFDFTDNGSTYQINYYNGPTEDLTELVIPKSYKGKPVTVLGTDHQSAFIACNDPKPRFVLTLNENIEEIKGYAFYTMWVTKVQGDTSNLSKLGSYAFSWANSPGGYTLDIRLDYPGEITVGKEIFNHMNVTARIRHATGFSSTSFSQQSLNYVFTDAHICGEPTWSWNDNHTSATGTFICTDPRCRHEETVDASIVKTSEEGKDVYTATAVLGGSTYTDTKTVYTDGIGACLVGHSVSLDGDIAVNFFMELSPEVLTHEGVYMQFTVPDSSKEYQEQKVYVRDLTPVVSDGKTWYVFKCRVAAKNMESAISAQLIDRYKVSTVYKYSVRQYADYLLGHINDNAEYAKAAELVRKMLNYGSYAANYFSNTDALGELAADIPAREEIVTGLTEGVTFEGATLSLKSQTTLSLYFVSEQELTLSMDSKTEGTDYELAHKGNEYVIRIRNIPASELNNDFIVKVNSTGSVTYSPMTYCYKAANSPTADSKLKNAVKALYQYWVEADKYFNTGGN